MEWKQTVNAVQFGMGVPHGVLGVGSTATDVSSEQTDSFLQCTFRRFFVLGKNDHRRVAYCRLWILVRGRFRTPGDHQPDMNTSIPKRFRLLAGAMHSIGIDRLIHPRQ